MIGGIVLLRCFYIALIPPAVLGTAAVADPDGIVRLLLSCH
jgi:hypothetical protein